MSLASCIYRFVAQRSKSLINVEHSFRTRCSNTSVFHPPERHFSNTGFTSYNSNSVMQKSEVPEVTCVDRSPVEVLVWEELFALTREEIETDH